VRSGFFHRFARIQNDACRVINIRTGEQNIPKRVLIVDDHDIVRQGVRRILETEDDWEVCGEASNGQEALRLSRELKPDAIIMDVTMPVMNGLEATKKITKANPDSKVLIFTMHEPQSLLSPIRGSGAKGVLPKSKAASDLTPALKTILAGQTYFH
jgi:two-component system, NarL family, nitrate/nitrite response regulator NarL